VALQLTGIRRYPVKSCSGFDLDQAVVERCGLAGDRRWMVVDESGVVVTAREHPTMLLITPELTDTGLHLHAPSQPDLAIGRPTEAPLEDVTVWRSTVAASPAAHDAHAWLSAVIGKPVRLVYLDDADRRSPNPDFADTDDRVSFADAYPVLLATEESLQAVNGWIADFTDVPPANPFHDDIVRLVANEVTVGTGGGLYGVDNPVKRQSMAVFLLKAEHGSGYTRPACVGVFPDVACPSTFADWIEQLVTENITVGCGGGNYCPQVANTRGQMAVFLSKTFGLPLTP